MSLDRLGSSFFCETVTRLSLTLSLSRLLRRRLWRIRLRCRLLGRRFFLQVLPSLGLAAGEVYTVLFRVVGPLVIASEELG